MLLPLLLAFLLGAGRAWAGESMAPQLLLSTAQHVLEARDVKEARIWLRRLQGARIALCHASNCEGQVAGEKDVEAAVRILSRGMRKWPSLSLDISRTMRGWRYVRQELRQGVEEENEAESRSALKGQESSALSPPRRGRIARGSIASLRQRRVGIDRRLAQSILLRQAIELHRANTKDAVIMVLQRLSQADSRMLGLPCEDLRCDMYQPKVYAGSMDALLAELAQVVDRWPSLAGDVGRLLLHWNYCDIRYRNRSHDLVRRGAQVFRRPASGPSPVAGLGWRRWGFDVIDDGRLVPVPLLRHGLGGAALASLWHRYVRKRCFPDPRTGRTPYDVTEPMYSGPLHEVPERPGRDYPYLGQWRLAMRGGQRGFPDAVVSREEDAIPGARALQGSKEGRKGSGGEQRSVALDTPTGPGNSSVGKGSRAEQRGVAGKTGAPHLVPVNASVHSSNSVAPKIEVSDTSKGRIVPLDSPATSVTQATPTTMDALLPIHDQGEKGGRRPDRSEPVSERRRRPVQASVYQKWKMFDRQQEFGVRALWNPVSYFYLRAGISARVPAWKDNPGYTWGLGYNDWNPGGWIVEFNQWNPQQIGRNTSIRNAEFTLGYRVPFPERLQPALDAVISARMVGKMPNLGGVLHIRHGRWFLRVGINKDLRGVNGWQWLYGFGAWDWKEGSINLEYANWGGNRVFHPNFRRNGEVLLAYRFDL